MAWTLFDHKESRKGFYEPQSCGKGPVTTIPRVSHVHIKVYKSLSCSPSRRLQSPSASNESHSTPSPGRDSPLLGASLSRSALSLSPTKDETTFPTAKNSASAVLQESNHTSELQYSSLLSEKPKLLIPTPEFFPRGDGTRSKQECNTKTKLVAKLMRR